MTCFFLDRSNGNLSKKIAVSLVERAFRTLKGVDLKIRPIHHWLEKRVRAHIFLCMLAYYVEWHLRESWKSMIFTDEYADREHVLQATRSESALEKTRKKKLSDGNTGTQLSDSSPSEMSTIVCNDARVHLRYRRYLHSR